MSTIFFQLGHGLIYPNLPLIFRLWACGFYHELHDPDTSNFYPQDPGTHLPDQCQSPQVEKLVGTIASLNDIVKSVSSKLTMLLLLKFERRPHE
jgi:hypothetical protein